MWFKKIADIKVNTKKGNTSKKIIKDSIINNDGFDINTILKLVVDEIKELKSDVRKFQDAFIVYVNGNGVSKKTKNTVKEILGRK